MWATCNAGMHCRSFIAPASKRCQVVPAALAVPGTKLFQGICSLCQSGPAPQPHTCWLKCAGGQVWNVRTSSWKSIRSSRPKPCKFQACHTRTRRSTGRLSNSPHLLQYPLSKCHRQHQHSHLQPTATTGSRQEAARLREEALRDAQLVHNGGLHGEGGESGGCTSQAGLVARCSKVSLRQRCSWCPTRPASGGPTWCSCPAGPQAPPPLT